MSFSNSKALLVNSALFLLLSIRCFGVEPIVNNSIRSDVVVRMLPLNERVFKINTGEENTRAFPPAFDRELFGIMQKGSQILAQRNQIARNPFGHFILSLEQRVIGFSFAPAVENISADSPAGSVSASPVMLDSAPDNFWLPDEGWEDLAASRLIIDDISPLEAFRSIEYINFGIVDLSPGIWGSLRKVAEKTHLRGLVIARPESLLRVREIQPLPQIRGIVLHVNSLDEVVSAGKAFPEVTYLCLSVSTRELLRDVLMNNLLNRSFSKLRAAEIASTYWSGQQEWLKVAATNDLLIRFSPHVVPASLEWLCVHGSLLSTNEMVHYDDFARKVRFKVPVEFGRVRENRRIAVLFSGMGFAGGGAHALQSFERNRTEIYWR